MNATSVAEPVGGGLQQAGFEGLGEAAETELAGMDFEGGDLAHNVFDVVCCFVSCSVCGVVSG